MLNRRNRKGTRASGGSRSPVRPGEGEGAPPLPLGGEGTGAPGARAAAIRLSRRIRAALGPALRGRPGAALAGFVAGALLIGSIIENRPATPEPVRAPPVQAQPPADEPLEDAFADPWGYLQKMQEDHRRLRERLRGQMQSLTESPGTSRATVRSREDEEFVYYEIEVQGLDKENVKIRVEEGVVTISGLMRRERRGAGGAFSSTSSFQQQFPVPPNADASRVQMEQQGDLLVVKFPKLN